MTNDPKILVAGDDDHHKEGYYFVVRVIKSRVKYKSINKIVSSEGEILESTGEEVKIEDLSQYQRGESISIEPESSLAKLIRKATIRAGRNVEYLVLSGISYKDEIIPPEPQLSIPENMETSIPRRVEPDLSREIKISSITPYSRIN